MFENRFTAGCLLAQKLLSYKDRKDFLVLGVPRGGVIVAYALSSKLNLYLDIIVARKLGAPNQPELAIGAVGPEGTVVLDRKLINDLEVEEEYINKLTKEKKKEVKERIKMYRNGKPKLNLKGKSVILVDDGIATGATVEVVIKYLKSKFIKSLTLAVPVAPKDTINKLRKLVDKIVVLEEKDNFFAVG